MPVVMFEKLPDIERKPLTVLVNVKKLKPKKPRRGVMYQTDMNGKHKKKIVFEIGGDW